MYLTYEEFIQAIEYVFSLKMSVVHDETFDNGWKFVLAYIDGVMYEISDTNDLTCWRIKIVNDDSLMGSHEIIKNSMDMFTAVESMSGFLKYVKTQRLKRLLP